MIYILTKTTVHVLLAGTMSGDSVDGDFFFRRCPFGLICDDDNDANRMCIVCEAKKNCSGF